jgi:hypothetical protein
MGRRLQGEERLYYLYILASRKHGTLYIGVTGDLSRRLWEHREGLVKGFTSRYGVTSLVYYEIFGGESGDPAGKDDEKVAATMEGEPDREGQSALGGLVSGAGRGNAISLSGTGLA